MTDRTSRRRILLVDDDPVILDALGFGLGQAHYSVDKCLDAAAALASYKASLPDLAIVDIGLPDMGGTALAEALLRHRYRPILILSSYSEPEWVNRAIGSGVIGYLVKPLTVEQLIPSIETALARFGEISQRLALQFGNQGMNERQLADALDQFSFGVIIVDRNHHIVYSNHAGHSYLAAGSVIINRHGKLRSRVRNGEFTTTLNRSLGIGGESSAAVISLRNNIDGAEIGVWSSPLRCLEGDAARSAMVIVNDSSLAAIAPLNLLKALFGLTKKEGELAHALVNGLTINQYCEQTFITRNTARTHLRSIYRKTLTNRQVDLIRLLSRLFISSPRD